MYFDVGYYIYLIVKLKFCIVNRYYIKIWLKKGFEVLLDISIRVFIRGKKFESFCYYCSDMCFIEVYKFCEFKIRYMGF